MSFKLPFNLQSIQDSLTYDSISKSLQKSKESIQPFTDKTTQLISTQLHHLQELSKNTADVSELPQEYLELERSCDTLFKLYKFLLDLTNETFSNVSYDYPPGNTTINKIRDANVGGLLSTKFSQLKNVSSPQELEQFFTGESTEEVEIQTISALLPKTLYGKLANGLVKFSEDFKESDNAMSLSLLDFSSTYMEIASSRLDMDKAIVQEWKFKIVEILNDDFIKVNELRKKVYALRSEFDTLKSTLANDYENENLIAKEDEFVAATEVAVTEMKKLLEPSKTIKLLSVFIEAQKEWFKFNLQRLDDLSTRLNGIESTLHGEQEE